MTKTKLQRRPKCAVKVRYSDGVKRCAKTAISPERVCHLHWGSRFTARLGAVIMPLDWHEAQLKKAEE